jgi:manganese-dependent inorganic pyrophosphatase
MFEATSDLSRVAAAEIVRRDAKEYETGGGTLSIAQVETVGEGLRDRAPELVAELDAVREHAGYALAALMVTDILSKSTELYASGDRAALERAFGKSPHGGPLALPGVMSRKKQVAPRLLAAFGP